MELVHSTRTSETKPPLEVQYLLNNSAGGLSSKIVRNDNIVEVISLQCLSY
jgi:hypothetical protein